MTSRRAVLGATFGVATVAVTGLPDAAAATTLTMWRLDPDWGTPIGDGAARRTACRGRALRGAPPDPPEVGTAATGTPTSTRTGELATTGVTAGAMATGGVLSLLAGLLACRRARAAEASTPVDKGRALDEGLDDTG